MCLHFKYVSPKALWSSRAALLSAARSCVLISLKVLVAQCVWLFATPWTVAYQVPPSMGFSRQEYWRGFPFPSPGDLPNPGIKPGFHALQADSLPSEPTGKSFRNVERICISSHWVSVYSSISKGLRLDDCWCPFQPPKYDRYCSFWANFGDTYGFPGGSDGKESTCNVGNPGLIPGLGRSAGEGKSYSLQYSGLENSMDCIVHRVAKSGTRLSNFQWRSVSFF